MNNQKRIAYQGMEGSNSQACSKDMAQKLGWDNVAYLPLISSEGVMGALKDGSADYGVMATNNHIAGVVIETKNALEGQSYTVITEHTLPIHHCLFVKDSTVTKIDTVASHIQALKQCRGNLAKQYPDAKWQEVEDTAIAARYLAEGSLTASTGVLCRRDAGEAFGLYLLQENLEDDSTNMTDFAMIELK